MNTLFDVKQAVRSLVGDDAQEWTKDGYLVPKINFAYRTQTLYIKRATGSNLEQVVEIPDFGGTPLYGYQQPGEALEGLYEPLYLWWKPAGAPERQYMQVTEKKTLPFAQANLYSPNMLMFFTWRSNQLFMTPLALPPAAGGQGSPSVTVDHLPAPEAPVLSVVETVDGQTGDIYQQGWDVYVRLTYSNAQGETTGSAAAMTTTVFPFSFIEINGPRLAGIQPNWLATLPPGDMPTSFNIYSCAVNTGDPAPETERFSSGPMPVDMTSPEGVTRLVWPKIFNGDAIALTDVNTAAITPTQTDGSGGGSDGGSGNGSGNAAIGLIDLLVDGRFNPPALVKDEDVLVVDPDMEAAVVPATLGLIGIETGNSGYTNAAVSMVEDAADDIVAKIIRGKQGYTARAGSNSRLRRRGWFWY